MKGAFRSSMAWLHTWTGLLFGWLLFAIFLTGTAAVFRHEITVWMNPELGLPVDPVRAVELAEARLREVAPNATSWSITPPDARQRTMAISWVADGATSRELLDPNTGAPADVRDTLGGDFFYRFHYHLEQPYLRGWWISGAAAVVMLVGLISGVVIHKRIFRDFFTFRVQNGPRRAWLDAHNLLGVLVLPFHLVITYSGLVPMLSIVMAAGVMANYRGAQTPGEVIANYDTAYSAYLDERRIPPLEIDAAGIPAATTSLKPVVEQAHAYWRSRELGRVDVRHVGDRNARVEVTRHFTGQLSSLPERLVFDGTSGMLLSSASDVGPAVRTFSVIWGLHVIRFAGPVLRWVYFVLSLASTALIGTGLVLWTVKRRRAIGVHERIPVGQLIVERLNVGVIAGLSVAVAAYFWANRLLPLDMDGRALAEKYVFFAVWAVLLALAAVRPARRAWCEGFSLAAFTFGALPFLNALTTDKNLVTSLVQGDWVFAGFDMTMLAIAAACGSVARHAARRGQRTDHLDDAALPAEDAA